MRCGGISPRTGRVNLPARIPALATPEDVVELFFVLFLPTTFYFFFLFLLRFFFCPRCWFSSRHLFQKNNKKIQRGNNSEDIRDDNSPRNGISSAVEITDTAHTHDMVRVDSFLFCSNMKNLRLSFQLFIIIIYLFFFISWCCTRKLSAGVVFRFSLFVPFLFFLSERSGTPDACTHTHTHTRNETQ